MVFNSYSFLLFFPIVLVLTQLAPAKWRNGLLLVASYVFYASWGKRFCVLLLGLTVLVYAAGLLLGQKKRRWLFWLGLGGTLGALLVYKYLDFGLYSINALTRALGLGEPMPRVSLLQPAGISFFTFQAAGYLIDVYRGKYKPEKNFLRFALFVSFFPQLLSGPIGRGDQLLPQYERPKKADFDALRRGFLTMTWGFFLKLCIADRAAVLVNTVYGAFESYSGIFLVFATAVYALQIYGDFAGYSYMAIGGAEMLATCAQKLRYPLFCPICPGVLAAVAYLPELLVPGLCLYSPGGQPVRLLEEVPQCPHCLSGQRPVARGTVDLCAVGGYSRLLSDFRRTDKASAGKSAGRAPREPAGGIL